MAYKGIRKETKLEFRKEINRIETFKESDKDRYQKEMYKLHEWMRDYEIAEDCCYKDKYLKAIRNEPNEFRRVNLMIDARRAS